MWVIVGHFLTVLGFGVCVLVIARIFRDHRPASVTMAWLLAIILIPYLGVPAYLILGGRKLRRSQQRKGSLYGPQEAPLMPDESAPTAERVLITAGMPPARCGNRIDFLPDGETAYAALVALIEQARHSIHVTSFILGRGETGRAIVELLSRKAAGGVQVRLLLDALGCMWSYGRFVEPLRRAGGQVGVFMPVLPLRRKWSANLRNHRKIVVVDGRTAIIGGMNIAEEYMGPTPKADRWLDTGVLIAGPAAADLEAIFSSDWNFASDEELESKPGAEAIAAGGQNGSTAQVGASGPDTPGDAIYDTILTAIMEARERIWIVTPYFLPDYSLLKVLLLQVRLGRDVRIIVPRKSNHRLADLARGRSLRTLVRLGARVFACPRMVHAKLMLFDRELAVIGSANFDARSMYLNYEVQLFMYGDREVAVTAEWMQRRMSEAQPLDARAVSGVRAWAEDISALVAPLL